MILASSCSIDERPDPASLLCDGLKPLGPFWAPPRVSTCAASIAGDPDVLYADCTSDIVVFGQCSVPSGAGVCEGGHRTMICRHDSDCSAGFRCHWALGVGDVPPDSDFGFCDKPCTVDLDCVRCDLRCVTDLGVCDAVPGPDDGD